MRLVFRIADDGAEQSAAGETYEGSCRVTPYSLTGESTECAAYDCAFLRIIACGAAGNRQESCGNNENDRIMLSHGAPSFLHALKEGPRTALLSFLRSTLFLAVTGPRSRYFASVFLRSETGPCRRLIQLLDLVGCQYLSLIKPKLDPLFL